MLNVEVFCPKLLYLILQIPHHKSRGISIPHKNCGIADPAGLVSTVFTLCLNTFQKNLLSCILFYFFRAGQNKGRRPRASSLEPGTLYTCSECKYMSNNKLRYDAHFKQPKHVNQYRQRAYKGRYIFIYFNTLVWHSSENQIV